jgi:hypothetical protein
MTFYKTLKNWNSGIAFPSKKDEDLFMSNCAEKFGVNCKRNPGQIAEKAVKRRLEKIGIAYTTGKLACSWISGQKTISPDIICEKFVIEIKCLRYYNGSGKRGNQGTGPEKIDSVFRKYAGVYEKHNKKTIIVLCADMQHDRNGKTYIDAFCDENYNGNKAVKVLRNTFRGEIYCIPYQYLTLEFLTENKLI